MADPWGTLALLLERMGGAPAIIDVSRGRIQVRHSQLLECHSNTYHSANVTPHGAPYGH